MAAIHSADLRYWRNTKPPFSADRDNCGFFMATPDGRDYIHAVPSCSVTRNDFENAKMIEANSPYTVEERQIHGETTWIAIRARGAEWSWLTPAEAAHLGRQWVERYGTPATKELVGAG